MASLGVIAGSGALDWALNWEALPGRETDWGEASAPLRHAVAGSHHVYLLARHGEPHRYAPHAINYRANLALLAARKLDGVVAFNTVGGIAPFAEPGALVLPDQIIDYTWGRAQTYSPDDEVRHVDFSEPYDAALRRLLLDAAEQAGVELHDGGVMGVTQGPRLETPAEIGRMANDGCAMVGMTGMPEAVLARELDLPFAALGLVVNLAAGLAPGPIDMTELRAESARCVAQAVRLLDALLERHVGAD
jgi:5'-methylthioinosine phosphorylase